MGAYNLEQFIIRMDSWGLTDVMLPFMLIFTVMFAILQKTRVLGETKKNLNTIVALVVALSVVIPHVLGLYTNPNLDPVVVLGKALPAVSIVVIAVLMLMILIGMFGGEVKFFGAAFSGWIAFLSVIIIVWIFGYSAGWFTYGRNVWYWLERVFGPDALSIVVILLVFGLVILFITGGEGEREDRVKNKEFKESLKHIFNPPSN